MTEEKREKKPITEVTLLDGAITGARDGESYLRDIPRQFSPQQLLDMYKANVRSMMKSWTQFGLNRDFLIVTDGLRNIANLLYTHPQTTKQDLEELLFQQRFSREFVDDVVYVDRIHYRLNNEEIAKKMVEGKQRK